MPDAICTVEDCGRPVRTRGYCDPHYKRVWRYGDPLKGGPIRPPRRVLPPPEDHDDGTRTCHTCQERKPLAQYPRDNRGALGRRRDCLTCHNDREAARYQADPEVARQRMRDHRAANAEQVRAQEAARYERHRDKRIEIATESAHRRRARMKDAEHEPGITVSYLRQRDGDACCYCGVVLDFGRYGRGERPDNLATLEHRTPISRGGGHTDANCALACWRCNIGKGSRTEAEWMAKREGRRMPVRFTSHPGLIA